MVLFMGMQLQSLLVSCRFKYKSIGCLRVYFFCKLRKSPKLYHGGKLLTQLSQYPYLQKEFIRIYNKTCLEKYDIVTICEQTFCGEKPYERGIVT